MIFFKKIRGNFRYKIFLIFKISTKKFLQKIHKKIPFPKRKYRLYPVYKYRSARLEEASPYNFGGTKMKKRNILGAILLELLFSIVEAV
ncbi:MAG: hypothetical protein ACRCTS_01080, partial [Fusobacteriaceae bacterium]